MEESEVEKTSSANFIDEVPKPDIYNSLMEKVSSSSPHTVVYDLETLRSPQQVGGWGNKDDMGVSVLCEWDNQKGFNHYTEETLDNFIGKLNRADRVVGFNHEDFDREVLAGLGYKKKNLRDIESLDIMKDLQSRTGNRMKLEDLAYRNLQSEKLENGKFAPEMWENGEYERVVKYCYHDVVMTKSLYLFGAVRGYVMLPKYLSEKGDHSVQVDWSD